MQMVILAGGLATRLKSLSIECPKSMLPIEGKPFLEHQVALLRKNGIRNIVLCIGHWGEQIEAYFKEGGRLGVHIQYSKEGSRLLGTGGALKKAAPLLEDAFFVMYGDSYLMLDYAHIEKEFRKKDSAFRKP